MTLGEKLRTARENIRLSQMQVAERLHINNKSLSHWEKDRALPPTTMIYELAQLYDVSADYLLGLTVNVTNDIIGAVLQYDANAIKIIRDISIKNGEIYTSNGVKISNKHKQKIQHAAQLLIDTIESAIEQAMRGR